MQPPDVLCTFFGASLLLALTPGPDNIFVASQAVHRGSGAGLVVTVGLCTGLLVHTLGVALGVAALFQASVFAFSLVKYIGVGYLLYLAYHAAKPVAAADDGVVVSRVDYVRLYGRGIVMNVTNPKVSLFFLAFLPQFTDPDYGPLLPQFLLLGLLFIISTLLIFGGISLFAGRVSTSFRESKRVQALLGRITSLVFIGLAVKLALCKR